MSPSFLLFIREGRGDFYAGREVVKKLKEKEDITTSPSIFSLSYLGEIKGLEIERSLTLPQIRKRKGAISLIHAWCTMKKR